MKSKTLYFVLVILFLSATAVEMRAAERTDNDVGTVTGTVKVVKTRVKTEGAKSDKHVIVYLEKVGGGDYPAPSGTAQMDQAGLVFIPHVMAIQKGTTVDFLNSDSEDHNIFCVDDCCKILESASGKKPKFMDLGTWGKDDVRSYTFNVAGETVLLCKLHPEMAANLVILNTPYFAVAEIDSETQTATYTIDNVPAGAYTLKTWNKKTESEEQEVVVSAGEKTTKDVDLTRKSRKRRKRK